MIVLSMLKIQFITNYPMIVKMNRYLLSIESTLALLLTKLWLFLWRVLVEL